MSSGAYALCHARRGDRDDSRPDTDGGGRGGSDVGGIPQGVEANAKQGVGLSPGRRSGGTLHARAQHHAFSDDVPNVEFGVQVNGSFAPAGDVVPSALPAGLAATATNTGPVTEIGETHQAVREWSKANGYRLAGPHWVIYGDPDPWTGHFDVEVFWSLLAP